MHGDHAADPGQIQEVPGTPEAVLSQPGVQGQHGQIQMPVLERLCIGFEIDFHVPVPAGIFTLPVPPVQIPGVKQSAAAHGDEEGHTLIGGGQRLNLYAGRKVPDFPAAQANAVLRSGVGNIPAGAVAVSQPDVPAQQECDVPGAVIQREDGGGEVILVAVAGKHQQRPVLGNGRQSPFPPVKEEAGLRQFHKKAAVGQKGHAHYSTRTAVP